MCTYKAFTAPPGKEMYVFVLVGKNDCGSACREGECVGVDVTSAVPPMEWKRTCVCMCRSGKMFTDPPTGGEEDACVLVDVEAFMGFSTKWGNDACVCVDVGKR